MNLELSNPSIILEKVPSLSRDEIRDLLTAIETEMLKGIPIDLPVKHHFSEGVYAREMTIPKGILVMGKIHRHRNLNVISAGEVSVLSVDGLKRVKAPFTFVASPGAKRLIFAHEDTIWTTIHGTHETDLEKIESEFIAKTYDEVVELTEGSKDKETLWLGA